MFEYSCTHRVQSLTTCFQNTSDSFLIMRYFGVLLLLLFECVTLFYLNKIIFSIYLCVCVCKHACVYVCMHVLVCVGMLVCVCVHACRWVCQSTLGSCFLLPQWWSWGIEFRLSGLIAGTLTSGLPFRPLPPFLNKLFFKYYMCKNMCTDDGWVVRAQAKTCMVTVPAAVTMWMGEIY